MIFDKIENLYKYVNINPNIKDVISFINSNNLSCLEVGKKTINDKVWYNSQEYVGKENKNIFESHIIYIDIQLIVNGEENIYYSKEIPVIKETNDKDLYLTTSPSDVSLTLTKGTFALFFPGELHNPGIKVNDNLIKKIVFKVKA